MSDCNNNNFFSRNVSKSTVTKGSSQTKKKVLGRNKIEKILEDPNISRTIEQNDILEKDVHISLRMILSELSDYKFDVILAAVDACILGALSPINGYIMAEGINGLNSKHESIRNEKSLYYGICFFQNNQ